MEHNIKRILKAAAAVAILAASAGVAAAQDYSLPANYGAVRLGGGFVPDPYEVDLLAGGSINSANAIGGSCRGYISEAPDFELQFAAGSLPLIISVDSSADTTLVVNGPDGRWYCDDDSGLGMNPSLRFGRAMSGVYDIWWAPTATRRCSPPSCRFRKWKATDRARIASDAPEPGPGAFSVRPCWRLDAGNWGSGQVSAPDSWLCIPAGGGRQVRKVVAAKAEEHRSS